ncbi:hypothetical protein NL676_035460 [Syzygium grande]|nr:hypothetical protein NL676_035460 [Syzygium grande]
MIQSSLIGGPSSRPLVCPPHQEPRCARCQAVSHREVLLTELIQGLEFLYFAGCSKLFHESRQPLNQPTAPSLNLVSHHELPAASFRLHCRRPAIPS